MEEYAKINIIYEDNHLLVVEKPIYMPVCEDESKDNDLLTILKKYIKDKYNKIITKVGINDTIANLDELDSLLDSLNITLYEKGKIKQEVGKSNVRLAITNKKISEEDKKLFEKIEQIIKDESNLISGVSKDMIEDYINGNLEEDNPDLRMVTLITGMYSEMNKAKNNLGNSSLYNYSFKLINEYINAYEKLKEE